MMSELHDPSPKSYYDDDDATKQGYAEELRKALSNMLWETEDPDRTEPIEIKATIEELADYLQDIEQNQFLGDTKNPIKGLSLLSVTVEDSITNDGLYQLAGEENFDQTIPVTLFFVESRTSAVTVIPIPLKDGKLKIKIAPLIQSKKPKDDTLRDIFEIWSKERNPSKQEEVIQMLLEKQIITRGTNIKKPL